MKKKIIVIVVVLVVSIIGVGVFALKNKGSNSNDNDIAENKDTSQKIVTTVDWFKVTTLSELEKLSEKTNKEVAYESEYAYVSKVMFANGEADFSYEFDENKNVDSLSIGYVLVPSTQTDEKFVMESISVSELRNRIDSTMIFVSDSLGATIGDKYYIISESGNILPNYEDSSYQEVLNGTATLELRILDIDSSVWVLGIKKLASYNMIFCTLEHCSADSEEAKIPCYVAITE